MAGAELEKRRRGLLGRVWRTIQIPVLAILISLVLAAVTIVATAESFAIGLEKVGDGYWGILDGAILRGSGRINTLVAMTPLVLTGLAVTLPFRAGLFNIGAEGQFVIGALTGTIVAIYLPLPPVIHVIVVLIAGFLGGAFWGFIPGFLRARLGSHEVITTIMLNSVAIFFTNFMVRRPIKDPNPSTVQTLPILDTAELPRLFESRLHLGFFVALLLAVVVWYYLFRTTWGFSLRTTGLNPNAAEYAGINSKRQYIISMVLAGGLAGLAGTIEVQGLTRVLPEGFAAGYGFDAIAVSLLAVNHPIGVIPAAFIFGILRIGGDFLQIRAGLSIHIVSIFNALILLFVAAPAIIRAVFRVKVETEREDQASLSTGWGA